ncbi:MAG: MATE family efflux transporter [Muribaculaceae bacterium]
MTHREILRLAIPSIIANITAPLMAMVDTAIVGHIGSAIYIAAIAVGGSLFNLLYWGFAFLRMGTSGMTAQAYGACDVKEQRVILQRSLFVAVGIGLVMIVLQRPLIHLIMRFMEVEGETAMLVETYCGICIYGAPAMLSTYAISGWFIGCQDTRRPMWISIAVNVVNIVVSLVLVYVFDMSLKGVATGTLVAQWAGAILGVMFLCSGGVKILGEAMRTVLDLKEMKRFFSVNTDIFLRTMCLIAVTLWFTRAGSLQGDVMLSVNAILMQFFIIFSYFIDGFAYAGEALAGRFTGARDEANLRKAIGMLFRWGWGIAAVFTAAYFFFGDIFLSCLSDNESVRAASEPYIVWIALVPFAGVSAFIWDGIYIGMTRTRAMLLSMGLAMGVFFVVYFVLFPIYGNGALWFAFIVYLCVRGIVLWVVSKRIK